MALRSRLGGWAVVHRGSSSGVALALGDQVLVTRNSNNVLIYSPLIKHLLILWGISLLCRFYMDLFAPLQHLIASVIQLLVCIGLIIDSADIPLLQFASFSFHHGCALFSYCSSTIGILIFVLSFLEGFDSAWGKTKLIFHNKADSFQLAYVVFIVVMYSVLRGMTVIFAYFVIKYSFKWMSFFQYISFFCSGAWMLYQSTLWVLRISNIQLPDANSSNLEKTVEVVVIMYVCMACVFPLLILEVVDQLLEWLSGKIFMVGRDPTDIDKESYNTVLELCRVPFREFWKPFHIYCGNYLLSAVHIDGWTVESAVSKIVQRVPLAAPPPGPPDEPRIAPELECCICYSRQKNVQFSPCNHVATCEECSRAVPICPLCYAVIQTRTTVFL